MNIEKHLDASLDGADANLEAQRDDMEKYIEDNREYSMATEDEMYSYEKEYEEDSKAFETRQMELAKKVPFVPSTLAKSLEETKYLCAKALEETRQMESSKSFENNKKRLASAMADASMDSLTDMEKQLVSWYRRLTPESRAKVDVMAEEIVSSSSNSEPRRRAVAKFVKTGPSLPTTTEMQGSEASTSLG